MSYWQLLLLILPVFMLMGLGMGLRRIGWLTTEADASLLRLVQRVSPVTGAAWRCC